jgi:hypothetical protein
MINHHSCKSRLQNNDIIQTATTNKIPRLTEQDTNELQKVGNY